MQKTLHSPEMCFSDVATAHLSGVTTFKYGDIKNHGMTEQFKDSPQVNMFRPALSDTVYDLAFSAGK